MWQAPSPPAHFSWQSSGLSDRLRGPNENQMKQDQGSVVDVLRFKSIATKVFQQYGNGHCHATTHLTVDHRIYSKLPASACHCDMHSLSSYTLSDNSQALVLVNPGTLLASLSPLLVEV